MTKNEREHKKERIERILIKNYCEFFLINGKYVPFRRAVNLLTYMRNSKYIDTAELEQIIKEAKDNYAIISNKAFKIE